MKRDIIVLKLSRILYSDITLNKKIKISHYKEVKELEIISKIDKVDSFLNGLQAAVFKDEINKDLFIISRGCDVGIGDKLFNTLGANKNFLPKYDKKHQIKSFFQDWIYSGFFCTLGIFKFYQYYDLDDFVKQIIKEYPSYNFTVGGSSLGGLLSQLVYINNEGKIKYCITYSAVSPWYILKSEQRKKLSKLNYLKDEKNIINYYSHYDVFRFFPPFPKYIGKNVNVSLESFRTKSNFLATMIERISWSHMTKFILFDNGGNIIQSKTKSTKISRFYDYMNKNIKYNTLLNFVLLFSIYITILITIILGNFLKNIFLIDFFYRLNTVVQENIIVISFLLFIFPIIFLLPALFLKNRWKYIILILIFLTGFNPVGWILILILSHFIRISSQ